MAMTRRALAWLWRKLASARLTLFLIVVVAVLCIVGLVLPQAPGLDFGSQEYFDWVDSLGPRAQISVFVDHFALNRDALFSAVRLQNVCRQSPRRLTHEAAGLS